MAVTKIWKITNNLGKVINYSENGKKTKRTSLDDTLDYAMNKDKTEKQFFVTGINCDARIASDEMNLVKLQYNKTDGIQGFHAYQSFEETKEETNLTPEIAHEIGVKLANQLWGDRFQVVVTTHLNTGHLHNHFVINSVSFKDGKRFYDNKSSYGYMRHESDELCKEYIAKSDTLANKNDMSALFRIGYGLYVVTSNDGKRDNGLIVNTVTQLTDNPYRVAVNINKANYSHHVIQQTGVLNVNCLSVEAPFSVFERFGFQSGRTVDKFEGQKINRSGNGLVFLDKYINAFMSLKVEQYVDLGTHGMFICSVTEARVMSDQETMTYTYYQNNVKPKPQTEGKKGFVCKVCGWIYEGDTLPDDIVCPLCKHGAADFEPIG